MSVLSSMQAPPTNPTPLPLELEGTSVTTHSGGDKAKKGSQVITAWKVPGTFLIIPRFFLCFLVSSISQMASADHYGYNHGDYYQVS